MHRVKKVTVSCKNVLPAVIDAVSQKQYKDCPMTQRTYRISHLGVENAVDPLM